jgi:hypothetical protein
MLPCVGATTDGATTDAVVAQVKREMEQTLQDSRRLTDQINREVNSQLEKARQATEGEPPNRDSGTADACLRSPCVGATASMVHPPPLGWTA